MPALTSVDNLILDLLEWLANAPRPYDEVMEMWRTSCPRLPIWEEANDHDFVICESIPGQTPVVRLTPQGLTHLSAHRTNLRGGLPNTSSSSSTDSQNFLVVGS